jgi:hypothetical protein
MHESAMRSLHLTEEDVFEIAVALGKPVEAT